MKKFLCLLIPFLGVMVSCSDGELNTSDFVAGELFTDSNIRVVLIDTLTVEASTMKFDSIITSGASRALVGKYKDTVFGEISTSSFFELLPTDYSINSDAEYDSIFFHLKLDKYYYNDTLHYNTIHVKRLKDQLKPDDGSYYYNTSKIAYFEDDLGTLLYQPRPLDSDTLEIKLSDEFGMDIFEKLQKKSISNSDEFKDYLKGITLQPGVDENGSIIGFSIAAGASFVRLYHSVSEVNERVQSYNDFHINTADSPTPFFNRIIAIEPNEYVKKLQGREFNLQSTESNNQSFIQCGIGISTRLQFPTIKSIYDIAGTGTILNAVLKITPSQFTYNEHLILRDSLQLYVVDQNNGITEQLLSGGSAELNGILNKTNQEFNDIYYEIPMGAYIEKLLLAERETDEAIILLPSNYNSTVDRFILGGNTNAGYKAVLELTYAVYDED